MVDYSQEFLMRIGNSIKRGIYKNELSQQRVAELMNVGKSTISQWINGKAIPPGDKLLRIAELLDIVSELFPGYQKSTGAQNPLERLEQIEKKLERKVPLEETQKLWNVITSLQQKLANIEKESTKEASKNLQILIVEDNFYCCEIIKAALAALTPEFHVKESSDGAQAIRILNESEFLTSLIVLDLLLPKIDGVEFLDYIRKHENFKKIPVIVITGADENMIAKTFKYGIVGIVEKPFKLAKLAEVIQQIDLHWPIKEAVKFA